MIEFQEHQSLFHLKSRDFSYIFQVLDGGYVVHRYFGKKVQTFSSAISRPIKPAPMTVA